MSQKREQIDDIFFRALQCASASQRATYLETACMGDSRLSKRIEQLVQAYPEAKEFLETPAATGITARDKLFHECPGSQIRPYTLVREIGRGGMGIVYLAHQKNPSSGKSRSRSSGRGSILSKSSPDSPASDKFCASWIIPTSHVSLTQVPPPAVGHFSSWN